MKTFTDKTGKKWTIDITIGTIKRIKGACNIDLLQLDAGDPPLISRLLDDELLLGEVIAACISDQFGEQETADTVLAAFDGRTVHVAADAFFGDLQDFFRARGRLDRATAIEKIRELMTEVTRSVTEQLSSAQIPGSSSTDSPGSPVSSPTA